jgi:hypothetical protein
MGCLFLMLMCLPGPEQLCLMILMITAAWLCMHVAGGSVDQTVMSWCMGGGQWLLAVLGCAVWTVPWPV